MVLQIALVAVSCEGNNTIRGIRIARYSTSESRRVLNQFFGAVARGDTAELRSLASGPVQQKVIQGRTTGPFVKEYEAAGASAEITKVQVVLGGADIEFTYVADGQPRNGRASLRFSEEGGWHVTEFALMVQY